MYDKNRYSYEVKSRVPRVVVPVKTRTSPFIVFLAVVLVLGALVGCGFLGARLAYEKFSADKAAETTTVIYRDVTDKSEDTANLGVTGDLLSSVQVSALAKQCVVEVVTESVSYGGFGGTYITSGAGSGVIISNSGHIITNYHVIEGTEPENITVTMYDGQSFKADWVRGDAVTDTAIIKINAETANAAVIGRSDTLQSGQEVIAIGNPLGKLGGSVTKGVVSAIDREIEVDGQTMTLLQIDASVNPGNSGGGLFNMYGALVGIVNAKSIAEDVEGIGFAIPIDTAYGVAEDLMELGYVEGRVDTAVFEFREIKTPTISSPNVGLYLKSSKVSTDIPVGAYIVSVDGVQVKTVAEWKNVLNRKLPKATVEIVYNYGMQQRVATLTLTQREGSDT